MDDFVRSVEATLFASASPLSVSDIQEHAGDGNVAAAIERLVERHHGARMDHVESGSGARTDRAIGGEQVEIAHPPRRLADQPQAFRRAAHEHVAADPVAAEQPRPGLAHRVEPLEAKLEAQRQFLGRRVDRWVLRQQQAAFEVSQPRRHHQIIGGDFQPQRPGALDVGQILLDQRQDRNLVQVDLLLPREVEQQVERPFPAVEAKVQRLVVAYRRNE